MVGADTVVQDLSAQRDVNATNARQLQQMQLAVQAKEAKVDELNEAKIAAAREVDSKVEHALPCYTEP